MKATTLKITLHILSGLAVFMGLCCLIFAVYSFSNSVPLLHYTLPVAVYFLGIGCLGYFRPSPLAIRFLLGTFLYGTVIPVVASFSGVIGNGNPYHTEAKWLSILAGVFIADMLFRRAAQYSSRLLYPGNFC